MRIEPLLLLALIACGPVPADPIVDAPRNECGSDEQCSEGLCKDHGPNGRYCEVEEPFDFVVVVPMSDTSSYAPNVTFLLQQAELRTTDVDSISCATNCILLPRTVRAEGRYLITNDAAKALGTVLEDAAGNELAQVQLPMRATYRPLLRLPTGQLVEATSVGLPLAPITAGRVVDENRVTPGVGGFGGLQKLISTADLSPGTYEAEFRVDPTLVPVIPPRLKNLEVPAARYKDFPDTETLTKPDDGNFRTVTIQSQFRALDGFSATLVDHFSGRAVSRSVVLSGSRSTSYLATFNQLFAPGDPRLPDVDLVVAPPADTPLPALRARALAGTVPSLLKYPEIPDRSAIDGVVVGPDGVGVPAEVEIVSTSIVNLRDQVAGDALSYTTKLSTDSRGVFTTNVPEGKYRVFVNPAPELALSRGVITLDTKGAETGKPIGARSNWEVKLTPKSRVSGRVVLQDRRAVSDVQITFTPSIQRATGSRFELPRSFTTYVDNGEFVADLDVGFYDVTASPLAGTRFAPFVLSDLFVRPAAIGACRLEDFVVKVPYVFPITLRDPNGFQLPYTWARVYARAEGSQHYVELQRELLDAKGFAELWFRKPELAKNSPCQ